MKLEAATPGSILTFWFSSPAKKYWFQPSSEFDDEIRIKFEYIWEQASQDLLDHWQSAPEGTLALIIVLDQFPLNMYRGTSKSFSTEHKAIELSHYAVANKMDMKLTNNQLSFLYMPLMHSENIDDQNLSVKLFEKAALESNLRFAKHHRDIIQIFKRFPHRNKILNRETTEEELKYLASPEAFMG